MSEQEIMRNILSLCSFRYQVTFALRDTAGVKVAAAGFATVVWLAGPVSAWTG